MFIPWEERYINRIAWEFDEQPTVEEPQGRTTRGTFETVCRYNYSEVPSMPTRLIVEVEDMSLAPEPANRPPRDPQALVAALQRVVPREFFDPDQALTDTTYLSPDLRVVCFLGMRFAGVRHVYKRIPREDRASVE